MSVWNSREVEKLTMSNTIKRANILLAYSAVVVLLVSSATPMYACDIGTCTFSGNAPTTSSPPMPRDPSQRTEGRNYYNTGGDGYGGLPASWWRAFNAMSASGKRRMNSALSSSPSRPPSSSEQPGSYGWNHDD